MFTTTCGNCGTSHQLDEGQVPPSGLVMKCPSCKKGMIVMPPSPADVRAAAAAAKGKTSGPALSSFDAGMDLPMPKPPSHDIIDLPAPKAPFASRPSTQTEVPDLLAPVGPTPRSPLPDLLTPVGPTSRRPPPQPQQEQPDLLAPVGPVPSRGIPDLMTPVGPTPTRSIPDLMKPVGPTPTRSIPDLMKPVGPTPTRGLPDLLTPVGPVPTRGLPDLLTPVGPNPSNLLTPVGPGPSNLLTPVGPTPSNLLTPVGPTPSNLLTPIGPNPSNLLTPVGPNPSNLLTPVGPNPSNLLTPVGPNPSNLLTPVGANPSNLLTPIGPGPSLNLPAPKGFFDEIPPPAGGVRQPQPRPVPGLDLDDLDVVPAGQGGLDLPPSQSMSQRPPTPPPFSMDGLDLLPPESTNVKTNVVPGPPKAGGMSYGDVELPDTGIPEPPPEDPAGVVSFGRPVARPAAATTAAKAELDLAADPRSKPKGYTTGPAAALRPEADKGPAALPEVAPARSKIKHMLSPEQRHRRKIIAVILLVLLALAGGAYYVYMSIELELFGIKTAPAKERDEKIAAGLTSLHKLMVTGARGHWYKAVQLGERVAGLQKSAHEAQALEAQAYAAAIFDEGQQDKRDRDKADALISDLIKSNARGPEIDKAQALRVALDPGKAIDSYNALAKLERANKNDPDIPLYMGWAAYEGRDWVKAQKAFVRALELTRDRLAALYGLGRAQLAAGDTAHAKETFDRIIERNPDQKHFGAWLGIVELSTPPRDKSGQREKQLAVLCEKAPERAQAHPRDLSHAWTLYGDEAMAQGRFEQAAERYRQAKGLYARSLDAMIGGALADVELRSQVSGKANLNLTEARRELDQALVIDVNSVLARIGLTRINLLEGKAADARVAIEQALQITKENAVVHYWHGKVLEDPAIGDDKGAQASYQLAIDNAPGDYAAYVALSQLLLRQARAAEKLGRKDEAKQLSDKAVAVLAPVSDAAKSDSVLANTLGTAYLAANELPSAELWFRSSVATDADNIDARYNLASTLADEGKLTDAIAEYQQAHQRSPKREDVSLALAAAYERVKNFAAAEKLYAALLSTDGGNVPSVRAHAAAGLYYARRDKIAEATQEGQAIAALDPNNPAAEFLRGVAELQQGRLNEAQKDVTDATNADPKAQYFEALGRVNEAQKALGEAEANFEHARQIDSNYAPPLFGLARVYLKRRSFGPAAEVLEKALVLDPSVAVGWEGLGDAYLQVQKTTQAIKAFQNAIKLDPKRAYPYYQLGQTYYIENNNKGVISAMKAALERAPKEADWIPEAWRRLGFTYRSMQQQGDMCRAFKEYLRAAPPNDGSRSEVKAAYAACQ